MGLGLGYAASTDALAVAAAAAFFLVSLAASSPHKHTLAGHVPVAHVVAHLGRVKGEGWGQG